MGFRHPLTTAEGVDTGDSPTGPGVRVYQDLSGPLGYPRGVVEFRDGVAGDAHATLTRTVHFPAGGSSTAGGVFSLDGGSINGVKAPALDLTIEEDPAGGYRAAATLRGAARVDINAPLEVDSLASLGAVASGGRGNAAVHAAAATVVGPAMPATAVPIVQSDSSIVELNANGDGTMPFPAFPNGMVTFLPVSGDGNAGTLQSVSVLGYALGSVNLRGRQPNGGIPTGFVRINWIATGW